MSGKRTSAAAPPKVPEPADGVPAHGWRQSLTVYFERRVLVLLFLGFSSGLPYLLVFSTLAAWLREENLALDQIGWFALAGIAYVLKFLWAPLLDHIRLPVLGRLLGRRRSWLVLSQAGIAATILLLGATNPGANLVPTALWAVALAFFSATQDVAADAFRVESLSEDRQGAGAGIFVNGYRVGTLVSGAGALVIADHWGWAAAYMAMAGLMAVGFLTVLLADEPDAPPVPMSAAARGFSARFEDAVVGPFKDFMTRPAWLVILVFVALFQFGDGLLGLLANPFYLDMGFSKTEIAVIAKGWGLSMSLTGALAGGVLVFRFGILPALLLGGTLQALSNLAFAWLAHYTGEAGTSTAALTVTIAAENLSGAMATTAFVAFLSSLCTRAYTATQYALLSAVAHLGRKVFAASGGEVAEAVGWVVYFVTTTLAAVPALLLLLWLMKNASALALAPRSASEGDMQGTRTSG